MWIGEDTDIDPATRDMFHGLSALIALPAAAFAGQPFFESAFNALRARRLNMDVPISLGVVLALAMSVHETLTHAQRAYFDSAIMLLAFLLLGRYLDAAMRRKTRGVAANLAALRAPLACRLGADGRETMVAAAALRRGDRRAHASGRGFASRWRRGRRRVDARRKHRHRRDRAPSRLPRRAGLRRQPEP